MCLLFRESSTFFSSFFRLVVSILCGSVHRCRRPIKGRLSSNFIKIQPRIAFSLSPSSCMFWNFFKFSFVCDLHRHFIVSNFSSNYSLSARNMFKFVGKFFLRLQYLVRKSTNLNLFSRFQIFQRIIFVIRTRKKYI